MDKWKELKKYIELELGKPMNNDDIPKFILEDVLSKMESLEKESTSQY